MSKVGRFFNAFQKTRFMSSTPREAQLLVDGKLPTESTNVFEKSVSSQILEAGQIAEWIIEQMEHTFLSKLPGQCEAASYDMSKNCWKYFELISEKIPKRHILKLLENEHLYVHLDKMDLHDFDALIVDKLISLRNPNVKLLDLNNNPKIGDEGLNNLLRIFKNPELRSFFLSNCGITDLGVSNLVIPLRQNISMQIMELRKNEITNDGAEMLADALKHKRDFSLFLNDNQKIGEQGVVALAKSVVESGGGLKVWLKNACPDISDNDKEVISKFTKNGIRF